MPLKESYPLYLANKPVAPNHDLKVYNKYTGKVATHVALADEKIVDEAITAAVKAQPLMAAMPSYERKEVLLKVVEQLTTRHEEFSEALAIEAGKPIKCASWLA